MITRNTQKKLSVAERQNCILLELLGEKVLAFLAFDELGDRLSPERGIRYAYEKLLKEGLVENDGHTKPLYLRLTPSGRERAAKLREERRRVAMAGKPLDCESRPLSTPAANGNSKVFKISQSSIQELSRLHLEVAERLERIAQIQGELYRKAA